MGKDMDLVGQKFGKLTVISGAGSNKHNLRLWKCLCECGNEVIVTGVSLTKGTTKSCGCLRSIIGKKFGMLTVIERGEKNNNGTYKWKCLCDCGNYRVVNHSSLANGVVYSCGCSRRRRKHIDLTGKQYGRLTVIGLSEEKHPKDFVWECQCECGAITHVPTSLLNSKKTKSCGCLLKEYIDSKISIEPNMKFGQLTVIKRAYSKNNNSRWECQCDCGNTTIVLGGSLMSGKTQSCGCIQREFANEGNAIKKANEALNFIDGTMIEALLPTKKPRSNNTSGVRGVCLTKGTYKATIQFKGKSYFLGYYKNLEDAAKIRKEAEERIFGEFLDWFYETFPDKKKPE